MISSQTGDGYTQTEYSVLHFQIPLLGMLLNSEAQAYMILKQDFYPTEGTVAFFVWPVHCSRLHVGARDVTCEPE